MLPRPPRRSSPRPGLPRPTSAPRGPRSQAPQNQAAQDPAQPSAPVLSRQVAEPWDQDPAVQQVYDSQPTFQDNLDAALARSGSKPFTPEAARLRQSMPGLNLL